MKKTILLTLLPILMLTSCRVVEPEPSMSREEESSIPSISPKDIKTASNLKDDELKDFTLYYLERMNSFSSYKAVTEGKTATSVLFINIDQIINVTAIKSEYSYQHNSSESNMYSSEHFAYYHNNKALFKNKNDTDYTLNSMNDYLTKYGIYPFGNSIEGYKTTGEALLSISREQSGENYTFTMSLDPIKATTNVKIQMKEFGSLDDYPEFSSITLIVTVKDDFTPVTISLDSRYKAQQFATASCHQTYTVTFSSFNENIEIPNLNEVKDRL